MLRVLLIAPSLSNFSIDWYERLHVVMLCELFQHRCFYTFSKFLQAWFQTELLHQYHPQYVLFYLVIYHG